MHDVRNSAADLQIGVCSVKGVPSLYVQRGQYREIYARFVDRRKAEAFMEVLKSWDEAGGGDE